jgi:hypothetical protein
LILKRTFCPNGRTLTFRTSSPSHNASDTSGTFKLARVKIGNIQ